MDYLSVNYGKRENDSEDEHEDEEEERDQMDDDYQNQEHYQTDYWSKLMIMVNHIYVSDKTVLKNIWHETEGVLNMSVEFRVAVTRNVFG